MMYVLEVKNISIDYPGKPGAVQNISFHLKEGEVLAIVGGSGSGKSTLIRGIMGILPGNGAISGGKVDLFGKDLMSYKKEEMRKIRGNKLSMIFQDAGAYLDPQKKIGVQFIETLLAHTEMSKNEAACHAVKMFERVRLDEPKRVMESYGFQLSGGMKQRAAIAMAMALKPKLLLADEPTPALDVTIQSQIVGQMLEMKEETGTSIVIVTHNIGLAANMADHICVMKNGEMVEYGKTEDIINSPETDYTKDLLSCVFELEDD